MNEPEFAAGLAKLKDEVARLEEMHAQLPDGDVDSRKLILRRLGELEAALRGESPAPADVVTLPQMKAVLGRIAEAIVPVRVRVDELEKRVATIGEKAMGGITIHADGVKLDGLDAVASATARLVATLEKPVRPVYDERGMLAGAVRADSIPSGAGDPGIEDMRARLAAADIAIASLERRASRQADHLARLEDRMRKAEGKA